ncbi:MAG: hypothetical protein A2561_04170 [Candidatus Staskawiczbacteria bacterium RIFOXYD1_FULL_32_13]|uniref:Cell division protein FtsQ/DivIB C-terminal domain-containing protein n=1 Tax=Candidatus Staskawiczbacteria bacterium RIFOXYD1_FULL_32_13 TaxID=1802234 RepID=A0A1G2JK03_9BACT|nr:MAG: hypothetical protein A2561_04170 [Candidatus Staskawiczbacteria bacterium RIFOXYD1_FULL_32_13]
MKKKLFQTLNINVKEREAIVIFCNKVEQSLENCYFVDKEGIAFEELKDLQNDYIIITKETMDEKVSLKDQVIRKDVIDAILKTQKTLKDNYGVDVKEVLIQNQSRLDIKTSEKWQIYLTTDFNLDMQITKLNLLLKEEITEEVRKKLQYIDLRFKDRAYYK